MIYFTGSLGITGVMVGLLRNSRFAYANPSLIYAGLVTFILGTIFTDYNTQRPLKHAFWFGFMTTMAILLIPLINAVSMPIIYDAIFATGFTIGGLGLVAYNAPSEQFLQWGGALGILAI